VGHSSWQVSAESVSHDLGVPLQLRVDVTFADRSYELKYGPDSIRPTDHRDKKLRTFLRTSSGADLTYVLTYSGAAEVDLTKRRIALLSRYFGAAGLSSAPDSKMPPDFIVVREKDTF
jgi:hypothetical protein